jgi:hypothetical protein
MKGYKVLTNPELSAQNNLTSFKPTGKKGVNFGLIL